LGGECKSILVEGIIVPPHSELQINMQAPTLAAFDIYCPWVANLQPPSHSA